MASAPDVLALGGPDDRRTVRAVVAAVVVAVLLLAGYAWWQHVRLRPDFTLQQLRGAYAGMVRPDGTNEVSTIDPSTFTDPPLAIDPPACAPLFATTVSRQSPAAPLDGVATSWLAGDDSVSLFTVRYPDRAAAGAAFRTVSDAASSCEAQTAHLSGREGSGRLVGVPVAAGEPVPEQLAFALDRTGGRGRYVLHLLRLGNTVSWQYRYDARTGQYDPTSAQQMMAALATGLFSAQQQSGLTAGG